MHTYSKRGVEGKSAFIQNDHILLYCRTPAPPKRPEEMHMKRDSLRVRAKPGEKFHNTSRLDLRLTYPVLYGYRVYERGEVSNQDVLKLLQYREEVHEEGKAGRVAIEKDVVARHKTARNFQ